MLASLLADTVMLVHFAFIVFVVAGALLLRRWPWLAWLHLPAALWGAYAVLSGTICPLTPLENHLRAVAGEQGYTGGYIEHYLLPVIYPPGLTRGVQWLLGSGVVAVNAVLYARWWRRRGRAG
jgi:hypothetical protein